jgi:hypothetical protein
MVSMITIEHLHRGNFKAAVDGKGIMRHQQTPYSWIGLPVAVDAIDSHHIMVNHL